MTRASLPLAVALLLACPVPGRTAEPPRLQAGAGLDGVCKPGRWTPVRVDLETAGEDVTGELVVDWGPARVRRAVALASPSRRQIDIYIRTPDVTDRITVGLWSGGREIRAVSARVRVLRSDEPLTLCVAADGTTVQSAGLCTATMTAASLPRSWRGYDAADRIAWPAGDDPGLANEQRRALRQWRAFHPLDAPGNVPSPALPPPLPGRSGPLPRMVLAGYLLTLIAGGVVVRARTRQPVWCLAALAGIVLAGSAAAVTAGRAGPLSAVSVRHDSVVQQFAGAEGTLVSMRARVEYPAFDAFELRPAINDASIDRLHAPPGRAERRVDRDGFPVLAGVFGLGSGQPFELEGVSDASAVAVSHRGDVVRITNVSAADLVDCRFSPGFSRRAVGVLRPGESAEARRDDDGGGGATFACSMPVFRFDFVDPRYPVDSRGRARLIYHLSLADPGHDQD